MSRPRKIGTIHSNDFANEVAEIYKWQRNENKSLKKVVQIRDVLSDEIFDMECFTDSNELCKWLVARNFL